MIVEEKLNNDEIFGKKQSIRIKGFLVIIMFWGHMFNHPERLLNNVSWYSLFSIKDIPIEVILCPLLHCAVPLFFFIGGYAFYTINESIFKIDYLKKQVKKLYIKYWIVFSVFIPICFFLGKISFSFKEFLMNFIGISSSYCGEWWFFSTYLLIMIFWSGIYYLSEKFKLPKNNKWSICVAILSIIIACIGYFMNYLFVKNGFDTSNIIWHQIYYMLIKQTMFITGVLISKHNGFIVIDKMVKKHGKQTYYAKMSLLVIICLLMPYKFNFIPDSFFYIIYTPILVFVLCKIDNIFKFKSVFELLGRNSTYMWLVHSLFLYKIMQKFIYLPKYSIACWGMLIIIALFTAMILEKLENFIFQK